MAKGYMIMNSRKLRKEMTDAEQKLWFKIRNKQLHGFQFRRQRVINNYIVDFVCLKEKLIIEVDGGQHADLIWDYKRTQELEESGYRVLRFWNDEVLKNIEGVLECIAEKLPHPLAPSP